MAFVHSLSFDAELSHTLLVKVAEGDLARRERMVDDIDWLPVLQKVFNKYGTQLHRNQVNHFDQVLAIAWRMRPQRSV